MESRDRIGERNEGLAEISCGQGIGKVLGFSECLQNQRDEKRDENLEFRKSFFSVERAADQLCLDDSGKLVQKQGNETEHDAYDEDKISHGNFYHRERFEQSRDSVHDFPFASRVDVSAEDCEYGGGTDKNLQRVLNFSPCEPQKSLFENHRGGIRA